MVPFVRRLPTASGGTVDVVVHELPRPMVSSGRCGRWTDLVQAPFIRGDAKRADRDWDWRWQIPLLAFGGGLARRPRMFQLCLAADDFPVGMLALLENERWIGDHTQSAVYVWYLAGAPAAAVADRGAPKWLTTAMLDVAVAVGLNGAAQGRLWLHAAPEGGTPLLDWYRGRGLEQVSGDVILPGPRLAERVNDGRYFRLTRSLSEAFCSRLDGYRS